MSLTRRGLAVLAACAALPARAQPAGWDGIDARARGQTVAFNAWAWDEPTNAYITWAAARLQTMHGVTLRHVRLRDTGEAVARVVAERAAGRDSGGAVDLIWINGPNFLAL
ncbi:MAG TPA: ABC transporter substrate-binding protein, partial [Acetobacteraceae bacterium]